MQTTYHRKGPGLFRLAIAGAASVLLALVVANAALAQSNESTVANDAQTAEAFANGTTGGPECVDGATQFFSVGGRGWVEAALRSRGLVLVDYETIGETTAEVLTDTSELIEIEFMSDDGPMTIRIEHADGEMIAEIHRGEREVLSAGSDGNGSDGNGSAPASTETSNPEPGPATQEGVDSQSAPSGPQPQGASTKSTEPQNEPWLFVQSDSDSNAAGSSITSRQTVTAENS